MDKKEIHYRYSISYLIIIIIAIISLNFYEVEKLVDKVSFAVTITSLILAVLAIFQTIISSSKQESQLERILAAHADLTYAAKDIREVSREVQGTIGSVPKHFEEMRGRLDTLAEDLVISSTQATFTNVGNETGETNNVTSEKSEEEIFNEIVLKFHFAGIVVLYYFQKANEKNQSIKYSNLSELNIDPNYALAFLNVLGSTTGWVNLKIHENVIIPTHCADIVNNNMKKFIQKANVLAYEEKKDILPKSIEKVNQFLEGN